MKHLALLFVSLTAAFAAVDGTVINRTTGKPQPGAIVALYRLGAETGPEEISTVRADAQGKFHIDQTPQGPHLLQSVWAGVTYNHILPPGSPTSNVELEVYEASTHPGKAQVSEHMVLFEPADNQLNVSESYIFHNEGNITYNDPDKGTLRFFLPEAAGGVVRVTATAPQGMPVQHAAQKTAAANIYELDLPIKPGDTRIDLTYATPFSSPGEFAGKLLYKGGPTRLVAPQGVTLAGDGIAQIGQEPQTQATIYSVTGDQYKVQVAGAGSLRASEPAAEEDSGPSIEEVLPRIYSNRLLIAGLSLLILALGFVLLYRRTAP